LPDFIARHRAARDDVARMIKEHGGNDPWSDPEGAALIFDIIGNGIALEKLVDPEAVPDDLFARILPVLIEAFDAGKL
jgi:hypothetical protein